MNATVFQNLQKAVNFETSKSKESRNLRTKSLGKKIKKINNVRNEVMKKFSKIIDVKEKVKELKSTRVD